MITAGSRHQLSGCCLCSYGQSSGQHLLLSLPYHTVSVPVPVGYPVVQMTALSLSARSIDFHWNKYLKWLWQKLSENRIFDFVLWASIRFRFNCQNRNWIEISVFTQAYLEQFQTYKMRLTSFNLKAVNYDFKKVKVYKWIKSIIKWLK